MGKVVRSPYIFPFLFPFMSFLFSFAFYYWHQQMGKSEVTASTLGNICSNPILGAFWSGCIVLSEYGLTLIFCALYIRRLRSLFGHDDITDIRVAYSLTIPLIGFLNTLFSYI